MPTLNLAEIMERLPHRTPMLLVDRVLDYVPDERLVAERHFAAEDPVFKGHFEGHPILPGMLAVESLAQAAGILVNLSLGKTAEETLFYFMGVENVRFRLPVYPGATLRQEVEQVNRKGTIYKFKGVGYLGEEVAVEATFTAKLVMKDEVRG